MNELLLNPRLPQEMRARFQEAWSTLVEPNFQNHIGIATSGSSGDGMGKLILLSREAVESSARAVNERFESGPSDVWFKSLPSFHVGGLGILIRAKLSGASIYEHRSTTGEAKWVAADFLSQAEASGATLISLVPTQVYDLVQMKAQAPPSVRAVIVGGGRMEESLRLTALELGWPCLPSYGMTETASQIATATSIDDPSLRLLSHADAREWDDGRLAVRASSLLTAQIRFTNDNRAELEHSLVDGWFITEDRGSAKNGVLTIEGRTGDYVKIGGEGVVLARLENKLEALKLSTGFSEDAAILAAADERLGAVIVLLTTASVEKAQRLVDEFNSSVAPFERIRDTKVVALIPRSPLGKLLRGAALESVGLRSPHA